MKWIIFVFILIPAAEISVLLLSGKAIGILPTFVLVVLTGIIGTYLAKHQGLNTIRKVQEQLQSGAIPGEEIMNGVCILAGGIMLLSPGFITDVAGLLLLWPQTRKLFKPMVIKLFQKWFERNAISIIQ